MRDFVSKSKLFLKRFIALKLNSDDKKSIIITAICAFCFIVFVIVVQYWYFYVAFIAFCVYFSFDYFNQKKIKQQELDIINQSNVAESIFNLLFHIFSYISATFKLERPFEPMDIISEPQIILKGNVPIYQAFLVKNSFESFDKDVLTVIKKTVQLRINQAIKAGKIEVPYAVYKGAYPIITVANVVDLGITIGFQIVYVNSDEIAIYLNRQKKFQKLYETVSKGDVDF